MKMFVAREERSLRAKRYKFLTWKNPILKDFRLHEGFLKFVGRKPFYALTFRSLEVSNFLFLMFQCWFWIRFFGQNSESYGVDTLLYLRTSQPNKLSSDHQNPAEKIFPYLAKCQYPLFGPSGTIQVNIIFGI